MNPTSLHSMPEPDSPVTHKPRPYVVTTPGGACRAVRVRFVAVREPRRSARTLRTVCQSEAVQTLNRARGASRTHNQMIGNHLLCQLSYSGKATERESNTLPRPVQGDLLFRRASGRLDHTTHERRDGTRSLPYRTVPCRSSSIPGPALRLPSRCRTAVPSPAS